MSDKQEEASPFQTSPTFLGELIKRRVDSFHHPDGKVYIVERSEVVVDVWRGLIERNIFSVPVVNLRKKKYYGMIDVGDIVTFVLRIFGDQVRKFDEEFWTRHLHTEYFRSLKVRDIMVYPISRRNPFHPIPRSFTLFAAIEALARERTLHRVPIIDPSGRLVNLLGQSQVLAFIADHVERMGSLKDKPITECMSTRVLTISEDEIALRGFQKMIEHNINGLAVVDSEGRCVENLSLRDLKVIQHDAKLFIRLYYKVKDFIRIIKLDEQERKSRPPVLVSVQPTESLGDAIKQLHKNRLHHIFVLNGRREPIGVLSVKDILFQIVEHPGKIAVSGH